MGRDHTIYALQAGYVKYYLDPERHPKRKYIGVVFERDQKLPLPRNSARRRRLGRVATTISEPVQEKVKIMPEVTVAKKGKKGKKLPKPELEQMRPGYMYRESNWEIGRTAEKRGVYVKPFKPRDRWAAWRKSTIRKAKNAEKRGFRMAAK
jgi:large subunit ribosomal protein L27